jgi:hypothetical protein
MTFLTRDNLPLSRPKNDVNLAAGPFAVDCKAALSALPTSFAKALPPILGPPISPILPISRAGEGGYRPNPNPSPRTSLRTPTL